jgi:hypothetical protein
MPQRDTSGIGERVPRELIEADFTVAFSLVDMAENESRRGNGQLASQLLQKAGRMLDDIRGRLLRIGRWWDRMEITVAALRPMRPSFWS